MLTPEDRALIDFERCSIGMDGPKDWNIENVLGLTADIYYNRLRSLIFDRSAGEYDAFTIRRLALLIDDEIAVEAAG